MLTVPASAEVSSESVYIFNTLLFLIGGFLVMWMAAGFAMLEAGLVRSKNVAEICLKNVTLYAVACIMFLLVGYKLMYDGVDGGYIGSFTTWFIDDGAALAEEGASFDAGYASASDFFFQMVFVATAASIVSGTVAERIKLFPFMLFTVVLTAIIYPIQGAWQWGGGWLSEAASSTSPVPPSCTRAAVGQRSWVPSSSVRVLGNTMLMAVLVRCRVQACRSQRLVRSFFGSAGSASTARPSLRLVLPLMPPLCPISS